MTAANGCHGHDVDPLAVRPPGSSQVRFLERADQAQAAVQVGGNEVDRVRALRNAADVGHDAVDTATVFGRSAYGRNTPFADARAKLRVQWEVAHDDRPVAGETRGDGRRRAYEPVQRLRRHPLERVPHARLDRRTDRMPGQLGPGVGRVVLVHVVHDARAGELEQHAQRDQVRIVQVERRRAQPERPDRGADEPRPLPPGGRAVRVSRRSCGAGRRRPPPPASRRRRGGPRDPPRPGTGTASRRCDCRTAGGGSRCG